MNHSDLARTAVEMRARAYAPYSGFSVGAALLTACGRVFTGCNVETAAYSGICAERTAIYKAISEGFSTFAAIAVAGGPVDSPPKPAYPCGVCRQTMMEFFRADTPVIVAQNADEFTTHPFEELLPFGFGPLNLK
jgi:cytidine deaminase